jgi:hypothetical protein
MSASGKDETMEDDPNINPLWDAVLGKRTDVGTMRMLAVVAVFVIVGGAIFSAI